MYGLPEGFDGAFLVGRVLEIVSYTSNSMILGFDSRVSITVESSFEFGAAMGEALAERQRIPVPSSNLMQLVGKSVNAVETDRDGTLTLRFPGGYFFRCFDDQPDYESYRIAHGDEEIYI